MGRKAWQNSNRRGSTRRGRQVRARVLARDPVCTLCHRNPSTICDHIRSVADGAPERYEDATERMLRGICKDCDRKRVARQANKKHLMKRRPPEQHPGQTKS